MGTRSVSTRRLGRDRTADVRVIMGGMPSRSEVSEIVGLPRNWAVEFHRDPVGSTNIILVPDLVDDAVGPTLVIYWDGPVVRLDAFRWDSYTGIGEYSEVSHALAAASKLIHDEAAAGSIH